MKKIDLITGFLGSGKTTFLRKYLKYLISKGEKVCVLENDFGAVNVDMMLLSDLRGDNLELEMVAGGCDSDCHKRRFKTKLIAMGMDDYTRIVIEPSGVFDVDEFFDCLYDEPLCSWYEIGSVISIVDGNFDDTLSDSAKAVLAGEVACAGKIVISKTQLYSNDTVQATKQKIKSILAGLRCEREIDEDFIEKNWDELTDEDFEIVSEAGYKRSSFQKKITDYDVFDTVCFLDEHLSTDEILEFSNVIMKDSSLGNVFRVKGFSSLEEGWNEINVDKSSANVKAIDEGQDVLIVIGEGLAEDKIKEILKKLRKQSRIK